MKFFTIEELTKSTTA
jgi:zinc D-Ala-D-Ala carboxypeptidase